MEPATIDTHTHTHQNTEQAKLLPKGSIYTEIIMKAKQSLNNIIQELSTIIRKKVAFVVLLHKKKKN